MIETACHPWNRMTGRGRMLAWISCGGQRRRENRSMSGFARRDAQRELTIAPQHGDIDAVADASGGEQALQVVDRCDRRIAEGYDDVPLAHACGGGGRVFLHPADPDARLVRVCEGAH